MAVDQRREELMKLMRGPTGHDERLVPEVADAGNLAQHLKRYQFGLSYCAGKTVLDLGSGVAYGAHLLTQTASSVIALDYDAAAVRYGRTRYQSSRIEFIVSDACALPLRPGVADIAIAFEVIEHVSDHHGFLRETCRVLRSSGCLLISTPNKDTATLFRHKAGFAYPAHVSEVDLRTFAAELRHYFADVELFGMRLRGGRLYALLRALDLWNLRLRLPSLAQMRFAREVLFQVPSRGVSPDDVVVSPRQLRQANHFLAICRTKRL